MFWSFGRWRKSVADQAQFTPMPLPTSAWLLAPCILALDCGQSENTWTKRQTPSCMNIDCPLLRITRKGMGQGEYSFFFFFFPFWEKLTVLCIGHFSVAVALWPETAGRKWSYLDMQLQRTNRPRDREALEQAAKVKEQECGSSHLVERSAWEWREVWNSPTQPVTCVLHQNCTCQ